MKLFKCLRDANAAALASNHSSQRVLDTLEVLRILARDADQGCIGIVETAVNERTCNALGRICGKCWTDVTEGTNMEKNMI